jgi:hypothetical protein
VIDIDIILLALKIGILVLLYLFIWRVVRSVVANVRQGGARAPAPAAPAQAFPVAPAVEPWEDRRPHAVASAPATSHAAAPAVALLVVEQSRVLPPGRELRLDGPLTLGRAPANDVVLDEAVVSGAHARLIPGVGGCDVEDLGSTNGTFVDGERVSFASLRHGSALRVGSTVLRYREAGGR